MAELKDSLQKLYGCKKLTGKMCCIALLFCQVLLVALSLYLYDCQHKHLGVVNITGIVDEFIKVQSQSGKPREEVGKVVREFGTSLEKVLHTVGAKNKAVILPAEAVITGAKDYTQEVRQLLPVSPKASAPAANDKQQDTAAPVEGFKEKVQQLTEEIKKQQGAQINQDLSEKQAADSTQQPIEQSQVSAPTSEVPQNGVTPELSNVKRESQSNQSLSASDKKVHEESIEQAYSKQ